MLSSLDKTIKLTIIIVDDCPHEHFFIKQALCEFKNITFYDYYNGETFLHFLQYKSEELYPDQKRPDIVILDVNMPKMSGFELFDLIERKNLRAHFKFFVLTTSLAEKEREDCEKYKLKCFQKPFDFKDFSELLEEIITDAKKDLASQEPEI
jgi:chemotaxis family two-component system response regulator Rcp1